MKKIDGTATISIETLDELREREQWYNSLRETLKGIVADIETEEYEKEIKKIDDSPDEISDEELDELIKKATGTVKIVINENVLRKLIAEFIDETKKALETYNRRLKDLHDFIRLGKEELEKKEKEE